MPASASSKSEFSTQPELGYRSKIGVRGAGGNGLRSTRASNSENVNPNIGLGNQRNPPMAGNRTFGGKPMFPLATSRPSGTSTFGMDLTNIAGKTDNKPNIKPVQQLSLQQQLLQPQQTSQLAQAERLPQPQSSSQPQLPEPAHVVSTAVVQAPAAEAVVDVQAVEEYVGDIKEQLFQEEATFLPQVDYMDTQADLNPKMRMILMDWLIEVHMKYKLRAETLHLTVNLIDRYLSRVTVPRKKLQLIGVVAMFIASKFEEMYPPELSDWVYITDKAYAKEDVLVMECSMLTTLSFQIMVPTSAHFFPAFEKANACNSVHSHLAHYIIELGLLDIRMLYCKPSQTAAAALLLSNELVSRSPTWPPSMVAQTRCTEPALRSTVELLRQLLEADRAGSGGQLQAVHKKFGRPERDSVSTLDNSALKLATSSPTVLG